MAPPPEVPTVKFDQLEMVEGQFVVQINEGVREVLWTTDVPMSQDAERGRDDRASRQPIAHLGRNPLKGRGVQRF